VQFFGPLNRRKDSVAFHALIGKEFRGRCQFVGGGNQPDVFEFVAPLFSVSSFLSPHSLFSPESFDRNQCNHRRCARPRSPNFSTDSSAVAGALVFNGIVQNSAAMTSSSRAMLNEMAGDAEQVGRRTAVPCPCFFFFFFHGVVRCSSARVTQRFTQNGW